MRLSLLIIIASVFATPTWSQAVPPSLFGEEVVLPAGRVRARTMLLRVPMETASRLLMEDDRHEDYWDVVMTPLVAKKEAIVLASKTAEVGLVEKLTADWDEKKAIVRVSGVAFAGAVRDSKAASRWLDTNVDEVAVGSYMEATVELADGPPFMTQWTFHWTAPELERRRLETWDAVRGVSPDLIMRRTLEITDSNRLMPCSHAVLLGAQMEPGKVGKKTSGSVLMVFARLEYHDTRAPVAAALANETNPGSNALWLFSMPAADFISWHMHRASPDGDHAAFRGWLKRSSEGKGDEQDVILEAVAASGPTSIVASGRKWTQPNGFEPSRSDHLPFRPLPCDSSEQTVGFSLDTSSNSVRAVWPLRGERWERCRLALEKDETDPRALEFPTLGIETMEASVMPFGDQPEVLRAWLGLDGRVRVCCARRSINRGEREQIWKQQKEPRSAQSIWCVDTPVQGWAADAKQLNAANPSMAAERLLAGVREGAVSLVDVQLIPVVLGHVASDNAIQDGSLLIGNYINTAAHKEGVWFNPRTLGEMSHMRACTGDWQPTGALTIHESGGPVEKRWWNLGLQSLVNHKAKSSGLILPQQDSAVLQASAYQPPGQPMVLGVVRRNGGKGYRWWVTRRDPMEEDPPAKGSESVRYVHFSVVKSQDVLAANPPVIDEAVVTLNENVETRVASGRVWTFVDPTPKTGEAEDISPPEPDGTEFGDQWYIKHHLSGLDISIQNMEWTLRYDVKEPRIVNQKGVLPEEFGMEEGASPQSLPVVVERPDFSVEEAKGDVPKLGETRYVDLKQGLSVRVEVK